MGPDILGGVSRGVATGNALRQFQRGREMDELFAQHGPGILAGDQNALRALAQVDPMAAYGVLANNRQDRRLESQHALEIQKYAATISAQQAAAEAAKIKQGIMAASSAQSPEEWDRLADSFGVPELRGRFQDRDAMLSQFMTAAQVLEHRAGPEWVDLPTDEAAGMGYMFGQRNSRTGEVKGKAPPSTMRMTSDGEGNVTLEQGAGVGGDLPKMNVEQGKNTGFLIRMNDANDVLNELEDQGLRFWQQNLEHAPLGLGNYARDPDFQRFDQARRDFVNAQLRKESGAVISDQEFANANKQYFPVPGDSPEVIAQKRRNRENAIKGVRASSGPGAAYVDGSQRDSGPAPDMAPDYLSEQDAGLWDYMTPDERKAILKTYGRQK